MHPNSKLPTLTLVMNFDLLWHCSSNLTSNLIGSRWSWTNIQHGQEVISFESSHRGIQTDRRTDRQTDWHTHVADRARYAATKEVGQKMKQNIAESRSLQWAKLRRLRHSNKKLSSRKEAVQCYVEMMFFKSYKRHKELSDYCFNSTSRN